MSSTIRNIVMADDDYDDIEVFKEIFAEICPQVNLYIAIDGQVLIDMLKKIPTPDVILLDLNMPIKSGKECLQEIRKEDKLNEVSIIILSTSNSKREIDYCLANGADEYYVKPDSYEGIRSIVEAICAGRFIKKA